MSACKYVTGPHTPFTEQVQALSDHSDSVFGGTTQTGQRQWATPNTLGGWDGDVLNVAGATSISKAYNRAELNSRYVTALQHGADKAEETYGRVAETMCAKHQIDDLAAQERAFRARSASYIRCMVHGACKRFGHSTSKGLFDRKTQICNEMIVVANEDSLRDQTNLSVPDAILALDVMDLSTDNPTSVL